MKKSKNTITRELEPLSRGRRRSLGEVRRELREEHARRVATARGLNIDPSGITAADLDHLIRTHELLHTPTEVPDNFESAQERNATD